MATHNRRLGSVAGDRNSTWSEHYSANPCRCTAERLDPEDDTSIQYRLASGTGYVRVLLPHVVHRTGASEKLTVNHCSIINRPYTNHLYLYPRIYLYTPTPISIALRQLFPAIPIPFIPCIHVPPTTSHHPPLRQISRQEQVANRNLLRPIAAQSHSANLNLWCLGT